MKTFATIATWTMRIGLTLLVGWAAPWTLVLNPDLFLPDDDFDDEDD